MRLVQKHSIAIKSGRPPRWQPVEKFPLIKRPEPVQNLNSKQSEVQTAFAANSAGSDTTAQTKPDNAKSVLKTQEVAINSNIIQKPESKPKKVGLLALLFQRSRNNAGKRNLPDDDRASKILLSSRTASQSNRLINRPSTASLSAMPGVRPNRVIFGFGKNKNAEGVQLASAAGLSRLSARGLRTQHSGVNVDCIRPEVLQILYVVERHYGKKPIVTSGYRSPSRNRKAGGARNSMHIYCKAVDIQVEGVSKWDLAKFMRTIPGRGGIGTYCRTKSVHLDTGPKRDWHYSCRRKSKRRRKA